VSIIDTIFPNWANPEAIAVVVGLRVLCNVVIFSWVAHTVGVRSSYTTIVGGLFGFSTVTTMLLLSTNLLGHPISYLEQLSQLLILAVSLFVLVRNKLDVLSVVLLPACSGAAFLMLPMTIAYAEIFVAP
jgi:hypothetical protein